jgi:hypothetical protein
MKAFSEDLHAKILKAIDRGASDARGFFEHCGYRLLA